MGSNSYSNEMFRNMVLYMTLHVRISLNFAIAPHRSCAARWAQRTSPPHFGGPVLRARALQKCVTCSFAHPQISKCEIELWQGPFLHASTIETRAITRFARPRTLRMPRRWSLRRTEPQVERNLSQAAKYGFWERAHRNWENVKVVCNDISGSKNDLGLCG